jgi:O-antigen ligase
MIKITTLQANLIALILGGYPLAAGLAIAFGMDGQEMAIIMRTFVLAISLLLISLTSSRIKKVNRVYVMIFGLFWVIYLLRMLVDTLAYSELLSKSASYYWIFALCVCLVPALALIGASMEEAIRKAFYVTWIMMAISSALLVVYGSTFETSFDGSLLNTGRMGLPNLNPISVGHLGVSLVICSVWYLYGSLGASCSLRKFSLITILIGLYLLTTSASRGPLVALFVVGLVFLLKVNFLKALKGLILLSVITTFLLMLKNVDLENLSIVTRILGIIDGEDLSLRLRQTAFLGAWEQFLQNPFLGDFLEEKSTGFYPHNIILESFMATGIMGGLLMIAIITASLIKSLRMIRAGSYNGWLGLMFIQYLIDSQFSGSLYGSPQFWGLSVLMLFSGYIPANHLSFLGVRRFSPK